MNTLTELHRDAETNGDLDALLPEGYTRDPEGFIIPSDGFVGVVEIVDVRFSETSKGNPALGLQVETEDAVKFWTNLYFSANPTANQITFKQLANLGITAEYLEATPSNEDIESELLGRVAKVRIKHDEGDMGKIFIRATFSVASADSDAF